MATQAEADIERAESALIELHRTGYFTRKLEAYTLRAIGRIPSDADALTLWGLELKLGREVLQELESEARVLATRVRASNITDGDYDEPAFPE